MTPEEKVALLKEAGVWDVIGFPSCIDKLFDLVAAHEREACAKLCEELSERYLERCKNFFDERYAAAEVSATECAAAIRARSENGTA